MERAKDWNGREKSLLTSLRSEVASPLSLVKGLYNIGHDQETREKHGRVASSNSCVSTAPGDIWT